MAEGKEILVSGDDCIEEGVLGQGAYATVFQVRIKRQGEVRSSFIPPPPPPPLTHYQSLYISQSIVDHML